MLFSVRRAGAAQDGRGVEKDWPAMVRRLLNPGGVSPGCGSGFNAESHDEVLRPPLDRLHAEVSQDHTLIGIDAHMLGQRDTGNETYVTNLTHGLAEVRSPYAFRMYTITDTAIASQRLPQGTKFCIERLRPGTDSLRLLWAMPRAVRRAGVQLLHVTYVAPLRLACPVVVTVHDVSYALFPEWFSWRTRLVLSCLVPISLRRAARIVTRELMRVYGIADGRIAVTGGAVSPGFVPIHDEGLLQLVCMRYGLRRPFLLAVGNLEPRKNLVRLVMAYSVYLQSTDGSLQLCIVGQARRRASEVERTVRSLGLERRVVFTGYVPPADLHALYCAAHLLVFPSLYEGFGLPPLEAMACGTPVVSSDAGALTEILGDAAVFIDPLDIASLSQGIRRGVEDKELRRELIERGIKRASRFSQSGFARRTLAVYREVLGVEQQ